MSSLPGAPKKDERDALRFTFGVCWDFFPTEDEEGDWRRIFSESADYWSLPMEVFGTYGGPVLSLAQTFRTLVPLSLRTRQKKFAFDKWDPVHQSILESSSEHFRPAWIALDEVSVPLAELKSLQDRLQLCVRPGVAFALPVELFASVTKSQALSLQMSQVWLEFVLNSTVFQILIPLDKWLLQICELWDGKNTLFIQAAQMQLQEILLKLIHVPSRIAEIRLLVDETFPAEIRFMQSELVEMLVTDASGLSLTLAWSGRASEWPVIKNEIQDLQKLRSAVQTGLSEMREAQAASAKQNRSPELSASLTAVGGAQHSRTFDVNRYSLRWSLPDLSSALQIVFPYTHQHLGADLWNQCVALYTEWLLTLDGLTREIETFPLFLREVHLAKQWRAETWDLLRYELALFSVKFQMEEVDTTLKEPRLSLASGDANNGADSGLAVAVGSHVLRVNPTLDVLRSQFDIPRWIFSGLQGSPSRSPGLLAIRRTRSTFEPLELWLDWQEAVVLDAVMEEGMTENALVQEMSRHHPRPEFLPCGAPATASANEAPMRPWSEVVQKLRLDEILYHVRAETAP